VFVLRTPNARTARTARTDITYDDSIGGYRNKYKGGNTQSQNNGYIEIHEGFNRTHFRIETSYDFLLNFLSNYSSIMKPLYSFFIIFVFIVVVTYLLSLVLIRIFTEKIRETGPTSVIVKLHQDGKQINRFHIRKPLTNTKSVQIETFDAKQLVQKIRSPPKRQKDKGREIKGRASKGRASKGRASKGRASKGRASKGRASKGRASKRRESKQREELQENFANPSNQGDRYLHQYARDYRDITKKFSRSRVRGA